MTNTDRGGRGGRGAPPGRPAPAPDAPDADGPDAAAPAGRAADREVRRHAAPDLADGPADLHGDPAGGAVEGDARDLEALRARLRQSVTAYVRHLRAEGTPPQRAVFLAKAAVRDALPALDAGSLRALTADVVRWSQEAARD